MRSRGTRQGSPDGRDAPDVVARLRVALCLATLVMLGLSWPLWVESGAFPRVPFVARIPGLPPLASWAAFGLLLVAIAAAALGVAWRAMLGLGVAVLALLVLQDQHRFQPWVYQFLMMGAILATMSRTRGLWYARGWFIALYVHSGLSKLDVSFCDEMGLLFLRTALRPLGLSPEGWPPTWRVAAILAMPVGEIAEAAALAWPRSRRHGRVGAVVLHAALLFILGPWGLRHSTIVLVWNAAMIVEVWIAFGADVAVQDGPAEPETWLAPLTRAVFWVAVVLPLGERWGLLDAWPSQALYASHVERTHVFLHEDELATYPAAVRAHVAEEGPGPWRLLDLTAWSRAVRGVPVYPQARACNGLAEALAARYGGPRMIRVVHLGRADRWTGRRARVECLGGDAVRRQGDRYRLNAHPSGASRMAERATGTTGP